MRDAVTLRDPPCPFCGRSEVIYYNYKLGWLCRSCLEICHQAILEDLEPYATQEQRYEYAVDLYCIMAKSGMFPGQ